MLNQFWQFDVYLSPPPGFPHVHVVWCIAVGLLALSSVYGSSGYTITILSNIYISNNIYICICDLEVLSSKLEELATRGFHKNFWLQDVSQIVIDLTRRARCREYRGSVHSDVLHL